MKILKRTSAIGAVTVLGSCLTLGLHAVETGAGADGQIESDGQAGLHEEQDQQEFGARAETQVQARSSQMEIYEVSELEGMPVENMEGESLGSVDSLALDLQGEHPSFIVVQSGGILGIGGDLRVVPIEAVEITRAEGIIGDRQVVQIDIAEDRWEQIPTHEREAIARLCEETQARQIYQHYDVDWEQRSMEFGAREEGEVHIGSEQQENEFGAPDRDLQQEENGLRDQDDQTQIEEQDDDTVFGAREHRETTTAQPHQQAGPQTPQQCELVLSSDLQGRSIQSAQQEELGTVDNVVFDMGTGRVQYVLMTPDTGFFGQADEVYALEPQSFSRITEENVVVNLTRQQLDQAEVLTQATIRERTRADVAVQEEQPQVFRYQRDEITFGRPDRDEMNEAEERETQERDRQFGAPQRQDDAQLEGDREFGTPDREGRPDHAQDPDHRSPPDHARDREFGAPEDDDEDDNNRVY